MDISLSDLQISFQESNRKSVLIYSPVEGEIWISASSAGCLPVDINLLTWPGLDNRSWRVLIFTFARHQVINLPGGQRDSWCFLFAPEKILGCLILHCLFSKRLNYPQHWHVLPPEHLIPHKAEEENKSTFVCSRNQVRTMSNWFRMLSQQNKQERCCPFGGFILPDTYPRGVS